MTKHYFDPWEKNSLGRPKTIPKLPILLDKDLKTAKAQPHHNYEQLDLPKRLQTLSYLDQLEILANERFLLQTIVANMQSISTTEADKNDTSTAQERIAIIIICFIQRILVMKRY